MDIKAKTRVAATCFSAVAVGGLLASAAIPASAETPSGSFVLSDVALQGCRAAGTLDGNGSVIVAGGCAVLPDSAPGGGIQVFTGGTWSGDQADGVTICFTFTVITGPQYPTPFCVGPLPVNTGPEIIPDPGGGTGHTLVDITLS